MRAARYILICIVALLLGAAAWLHFHRPEPEHFVSVKAGLCQVISTGSGEKKNVQLPDGSRVILDSSTVLRIACDFSDTAWKVSVDGEAYFNITPAAAGPFIIISKDLSVVLPHAVFHLRAYSGEAGEELDLLRGSMTVRKAYPSPDSLPETLGAGDMVMINRSIDLMEKETFDTAALSQQVKRLPGF